LRENIKRIVVQYMYTVLQTRVINYTEKDGLVTLNNNSDEKWMNHNFLVKDNQNSNWYISDKIY